MTAGKIEIRRSGEKFRFVVLNRSGDKLLQSGQLDEADHEAGRVFAGEGRERRGDRRRDQACRRCNEEQRASPRDEALTRAGPRRPTDRAYLRHAVVELAAA